MYSEEFKTAVREDLVRRCSEDDAFKTKFLQASNQYKNHTNEFREVVYEQYAQKDEFKKYLQDNDDGGVWDTVKGFAKDVASVPSELMQGAETTTAQMRMFGNFLQGDSDELEKVYQDSKNIKPTDKAETTVGGWVKGAANTLPFLATSMGTGFAGGAVGSLAGPGGTAVGFAAGSAAAGFAQGWGEMYSRLRNEGVDDESAKAIALAVAPVYAGIEALQVKKIPGVATLMNKYLGAPMKKLIATRMADKVFKGKVQRALGEYAGEIISQSAEEGAQEMALNAGEQYGRNDGFDDFSVAENVGAGVAGFKESLGPFAVIQSPHIARRAYKGIKNSKAKSDESVDEIGALGDIRGDGATSGAETTTGGESGTLTGSTTSTIGGKTTVETHTAGDIVGAMEAPTVPEGTPLGSVFWANVGGVDSAPVRLLFRNVDGVAVPLSEKEIEALSDEEVIAIYDAETDGGASISETTPVESGFESAPVLEIPLEKLQLSKDVPNFKEGADAKTGVVKGEELEGKYERTGTAPIVVFERLNGDLEVITGRHRLDLAKRSGEKTIPSQIVREADGFTVEDAKTFDAESNIRDEKGTVKDYAHYFRNKDISRADAESRGLVARKKGQQGWAIGKQASDELYGLYRNGKISDDRVAAIARGAPNDADVQRAALRSSQGMDALTLEIHTRRLAAYKAENTSDVSDGGGIQGDLFGEDDSAMQEIVAISKAAGELVKENKQKIAAVSGAVKRPEIAREMGVDINNPEQVKAAIQALEYENSRLISPTPEIEILNKIRRRAGLSEIVDESTTDSEVDVHHDDDTASLDLGFDAKKEGMEFDKRSYENEVVLKSTENPFGFVNNNNGKDFFAEITPNVAQKLGINPGKIYLQNGRHDDNTDKGFGRVHIYKRHISQLNEIGFETVEDFVRNLLNNANEIYKQQHKDSITLFVRVEGNSALARISLREEIGGYTITTAHPARFNRNLNGETLIWKDGESSFNRTKLPNPFSSVSSNTSSDRHSRPVGQNRDSLVNQSENSAESQEENSDNLNPDSSAKVVAPVSASTTASSASSTASSTSTVAGATVLTAEEKASRSYAVLRKLASAVFKARKAILSRKIYDGGRILPRGIKLDKTTNRLVGMCSIADIRRYISKAFELPISSGIRDGSKSMLGAYWNSLQAISMKSGHLNDIQSVAHELGHHLEMILFGYTLNGSKTDVEAELASYGKEKFGDAYASSDLAREGFAELIADILNENPDVKTRCPIAYEVLRQALADNPVVSKVFNNIRQMIIINKDADAWAKLNANIRRKNDVERSPLVQKIQEFWEKALRALTDSLEGLDRLRKFLNEQRPGSGDRFWEHANNYRGGHLGQIDLCIKVHQVDIDGVVVGKSLLAIIKDNLKTAFDRENINAYLIARRCIEYYRANPKERTADCRKKFGIEYDVAVQVYNESTPGMRKCAEELDVYMRNNLKLLLDGKVISRKLYDKLIKNKGYVPMQRYMEAINESATSGSGKGFANVSSPIRSFFGSDREIIAGIDTIIEQTIQFREIAQKNRVALEVIRGISGGTATGNWATPARDKYSVTDVDLKKWAELVLTYKERTGEVETTTGDVRRQAIEEIIAELEAQIEADADLSLILKIYEKEAKEDKANGIITALNGNGEKVAWQIHDKGLYFALANLDPIGAQFWSTLAGRFLSFPTRALRAGATSAVGFVFANLIRDTQAATVLSNNKYRPWQSFTKGFLPSLVGKIPAVKRRAMAMKMAKEFLEANGELYDEWVASGGSMATSIDNTKARAEVTADELLADGFFGAWFARFKHSKTSTAMDAMLLPFETLAKVSEEMPRLAEYRNAREAEIKRLMKENGFTRAEAEAWWKSEKGSYARIKAANHSKSVTLNFSRSGWLSYHLNMVIPFFNAGMQGLDRFRTDLNPCDWRKLVTALYHLNLDEAKESVNKDNSVKFAKLVAIAGIVSALSWFSLRDDDDDDDETKNAKDKIHDWRKRAYWNFQFGDTIITIPKSQELAPFCAVFEKMFNAVSGTKQDAGSDVLGNIWHVLVPSFRPQVINMYYELESGYSSFTEAPLESQSLKALPKFVRANATTSDTARYLAQVFHNYGIEVSPITLDAGISLAFSTLGRDVVGWIADPVVRTFGGMPDKMDYDWKETAFTKRFFVNEFTPSVYVKKFHDMAADCNRIRALERHVADGRVYSRNGVSDADAKKINWYNGDYDGHPRYWHIRKVQKAMADARTDMIKIANDTTLSPEEKREKTLLLRKFVDRCAKNAVEILKQK
jgi:hypothetical protein